MQLRWSDRNRSIGILDALALVGLTGFLVARFVPVARLPFWGCALRETTGVPCPGCGLTRVAERMSHFNFAGAFDANPLGAALALAFMALIPLSAVHLLLRTPVPELVLTPSEARRGRWLLGGVVAVNYGWVVAQALGGA